MGKYWRVYRTFFTSSFNRELEFRANFIAKILQNCAWVFFSVIMILVIYGNTDSVAGWGRADATVLFGACILMNSVCFALFMSLHEIPQQVRQGTLDFVVTKPIDPQFWVSSRKFNFDQIGSIVASLLMIGYGVATLGRSIGPMDVLAFLVLMITSVVIFYSFTLFLMTLGIWFVRVDNLWALAETITWMARYPMEIYSGFLQRVFLFVVPFAFLAAMPASQLVRGADLGILGLGIVWAVVFFFLARRFWNHALRSYTSASS